jgi:hypothetical protein
MKEDEIKTIEIKNVKCHTLRIFVNSIYIFSVMSLMQVIFLCARMLFPIKFF